jgi:hypothetical protein
MLMRLAERPAKICRQIAALLVGSGASRRAELDMERVSAKKLHDVQTL